MKWVLVLFVGAISAFSLGGCTPVGIAVGGAAAAGVVVAEERSVEDAFKDTGIKLDIANKLFQESETLFVDISTIVFEARVLMMGEVAREEDRQKALEIAWSNPEVKAVLNEIKIRDENKPASKTSDAWITAKLKTRLVQDLSIKHINYSVDTVNRVIYLMGIAQNQAELNRVKLHARDISGVDGVISHVILKTDPRRN
ncbi:BON domain-containing protein [Sneathiella glossodoripedis]|uniref:BON domain-containing protein n=1 Tax=Sneathiella glossodoripedis TaxID=418853 RepID=UPI00046F8FC4|nr:BON domain-containing protein [Sneathiella glossodoripedis]